MSVNMTKEELHRELKNFLLPENATILDIIEAIDPVMKFSRYYKYGFIYTGRVGQIDIIACQDEEMQNSDDIYRAELLRNMKLSQLRTQLEFYLQIGQQEYRWSDENE